MSLVLPVRQRLTAFEDTTARLLNTNLLHILHSCGTQELIFGPAASRNPAMGQSRYPLFTSMSVPSTKVQNRMGWRFLDTPSRHSFSISKKVESRKGLCVTLSVAFSSVLPDVFACNSPQTSNIYNVGYITYIDVRL